MKKTLGILLSILVLHSFLFSQEQLNTTNASWTTVIPGMVISEPALTSYGFCVITDAQEISTFTNNGKMLWEKKLERSRDAFASTLSDDFFAVITHSGKKLTLLNPSGCEIWTKELDFSVTHKPFSGRDGRFFICGQNVLQCYGINGVRRWSIETPEQSSLPVLELNDGSLVIFLQEIKDKKTTGIRISPFGEIVEEITFSGEVISATNCNEGVLVSFSDGTAGLFSVTKDCTQSKWVLLISITDTQQINSSRFVVSTAKDEVYFLQTFNSSIQAHKINPSNGQILHSFQIKDINGFKLQQTELNTKGLLVCDDKTALFYNKDAYELFRASLPEKNGKDRFNYALYTQDNHLILCGINWSLNAFKITQSSKEQLSSSVTTRNYSSYIKPEFNNYSFAYINSIDRTVVSSERSTTLKNGDYGPKEIEWSNQLLGYCESLSSFLQSSDFGIHPEKSPFETDSTGVNKLLEQLTLYATTDTTSYSAIFLSTLQNKSHIQTLLSGIANNGYDPDRKILDAIEELSVHYTSKDERLINSTCDAVYAICLFMGRPAFNSKGKDILAKFLTPTFSPKTRAYARETLKKIADLNL